MATKIQSEIIKIGSWRDAAMGPGLRKIPVPIVPPRVTATPKVVPKTFHNCLVPAFIFLQYVIANQRKMV